MDKAFEVYSIFLQTWLYIIQLQTCSNLAYDIHMKY